MKADGRVVLAALGAYAGHLAGAPLAVLLAVDASLSRDDAEFDAGRIAQSIMLAAHALGLEGCSASFFPAANVEQVGSLVRIGAPWRIRTAISLGHPAPAPGQRLAIPSGRLPLDRLVIELEQVTPATVRCKPAEDPDTPA